MVLIDVQRKVSRAATLNRYPRIVSGCTGAASYSYLSRKALILELTKRESEFIVPERYNY
jgi:hypothetical protein